MKIIQPMKQASKPPHYLHKRCEGLFGSRSAQHHCLWQERSFHDARRAGISHSRPSLPFILTSSCIMFSNGREIKKQKDIPSTWDIKTRGGHRGHFCMSKWP